MIITIILLPMPGPTQITEISMRIDTDDPVEGLTRAMIHLKDITTVPIMAIRIELGH